METSNTNIILSWSAPTRGPVERGPIWYASAGVFALICGAYSILTGAWTLAIVVVIGAALYFLLHKVHPPVHTVEIRKDGFTVDGTLTTWEHCTGFWMYKHENDIELHIERTKGWRREFVVLVQGVDHFTVAEAIAQFVPYEANRRERFLDILIRLLKL